jgi:RNA polymerase sigma-70 factor (ECF subfamily)
VEQAVARSDTEPRVEDPDLTLVQSAMAGDLRAFERLYRRHVGRIHAVCLRLGGERAFAEDCTQETFVRAWTHLAGFRRGARFGSWLYRIAINVVLGELRGQRRRDRHLQPADVALDGLPAGRETPDAAMDLERALRRLPERARMVFVLHDVEGHRHEEIADMLEIAVGTSKAQLHRARRLLQEGLHQ